MSKYGKFNIPVPDFTDEINALKDLLEKGEIDQKEYNKKFEYFRVTRLSYIVATNGGYTPPKRRKAEWEGKLTELKEAHLASKQLQYREQLLQAQKEMENQEPTDSPS